MSAKFDVKNNVFLLLSGAVNYITKPFEIEELLARITVQLRKSSESAVPLIRLVRASGRHIRELYFVSDKGHRKEDIISQAADRVSGRNAFHLSGYDCTRQPERAVPYYRNAIF